MPFLRSTTISRAKDREHYGWKTRVERHGWQDKEKSGEVRIRSLGLGSLSIETQSQLAGGCLAHLLVGFVDLCDHLRTALARRVAFLLVPATFRPDQARGKSFGNRRQNLNDAGRELATRPVIVPAGALFARRTKAEDLRGLHRSCHRQHFVRDRQNFVQI